MIHAIIEGFASSFGKTLGVACASGVIFVVMYLFKCVKREGLIRKINDELDLHDVTPGVSFLEKERTFSPVPTSNTIWTYVNPFEPLFWLILTLILIFISFLLFMLGL